ncbi:hypothetical protein [Streptomyces antimicrobicus]|uniref:Serine/threonine protein kinase n=1 Tax=Streptomyces antimicrobicus TaxID=2883108 RepID=A0ABS8B4R7_9ACTN|nr:hypothetical protein [Streptomyces antimicrobicus]MCB5179608.1 hypothetical protein [Streptomyces antimicrobicus]
MSDVVTSGDGERGDDGRRSRTRKAAELAAVLSAVTALAALVLGLFGFLGSGGGPGDRRSVSAGEGRPVAPPAESPSAAPTGPLPGGPSGSAAPSSSGPSGSPAPSVPPAPDRPAQPSPPPVPSGWHVVRAKALTLALAVPDGWKLDVDTALQATWVSPDGRYVIGVKRDSSNGRTAQSAAVGQLAWYRRTEESKMEALTATTHADRQGDRDAARLELDYHWPGRDVPCHRSEVFVAGEHGQVYQLLVNDQQYDARPSQLPQLLATARAQLRTDVTG